MNIDSLNLTDVFVQGTFLFICIVAGLFFVFRDNLEKYQNPDNVSSLSNTIYNFFKALVELFQLKLTFPTLFVLGGNNDKSKETPPTKPDQVDTVPVGTTDNIPKPDDKSKSKDTPKEDTKFNIMSLLPVIVISIFIVGILGNGVADEWMDSDDKYHFYLKSLWAGDLLDKGKIKVDNTKYIHDFRQLIRKKSFERVFNNSTDERTYNQLFYHAQHEIMDADRGSKATATKNNNIYSNYVKKSQKLTEYSRIFALGFFFVLICVFLNLFMIMTRSLTEDDLKPTDEDKEKSSASPDRVIGVFTVFSFFIISFFLAPNFASYSTVIGIYSIVLVITYFGVGVSFLSLLGVFKKIRFTVFIYSVVYLISFSGYIISSKSWLYAEKEATLKIYGTFKTKNITTNVKEIMYMKDTLKLNANY